MWSREVQAMLRPRGTYRALADEVTPSTSWILVRRPLKWFLLLGSFVSITGSARLLPSHLLFTFIAWGFIPIAQTFWVMITLRIFGRRPPVARTVDLFFVGQGPWYLFMLIVSGVCVFTTDTWTTLGWMMEIGLLPALLIGTFAYSLVLDWACFRTGYGLGPRRGLLATVVYAVNFGFGTWGLYYVLVGNLQPLLGIGTA